MGLKFWFYSTVKPCVDRRLKYYCEFLCHSFTGLLLYCVHDVYLKTTTTEISGIFEDDITINLSFK